MAAPTIVEETPLSMAELKDELSSIKKRDEDDLNFRAGKTEDYLNQFVTLGPRKAKELIKKLEELDIPRLKELHIRKIVDVMPTKPEEVKSVMEAYPITISSDNIKKIVSTVAEFL